MSKKTQTEEVRYPRFIQNKPCGMDKFAGGSQSRLAQSIADHFVRNDESTTAEESLPRIIGIEGGWGSGKSNVIKLLKNKLSSNESYYFFEYDAWGHQEDLQRRSLLELLTAKLIDDGLLTGDATIRVKGGADEKVTWDKKLKYLLARKTETVTEKFPRISNGMAAAALVAILTPIFTFIAYAVKPEESSFWFDLLSILIAGLPVLIALLVWLRARHKNPKKYNNLSYLLAIYDKKVESDVCYETLSEDEPTVREFKAWMQDISDFIRDNEKPKLVIVFDNMDRLPAEKVKELWSSIHTFFAEDGFENVWAIIPFDETHLTCAFGNDENGHAKLLAKYFISKTFPIVYRVSDPVITDYRAIISTLFSEAFGDMYQEEANTINRIYRLLHSKPNMREIISFINELVAIHQQWGGSDISIVYMAIYIIKRDEIKTDPVKKILSGDYLGDIQKIVRYTYDAQGQIAALAYGVEVDHAKQIPIKDYIINCIKRTNGFDINKYSDNKNFSTVLEEEVMQIDDSLIDDVILCLDNLDSTKVARLDVIWNYIGQRRQPKSQESQVFSQIDEILMRHVRQATKQSLVDKIVTEICKCSKFDGANYYRAMSGLDKCIKKNCPECNLNLQEITKSPEIFIPYATLAMHDDSIKKYKLRTDNDSLNNHLSSQLPHNLISADIIYALKKNGYDFSALTEQTLATITDHKVDVKNFNSIFSALKVLYAEGSVLPMLSNSEIQSLYEDYVQDKQTSGKFAEGYYDISAMAITIGINIDDLSPDTVKGISEALPYYLADCSELISNSVSSWTYPLHMHVIQHIIQNKKPIKVNAIELLPISDRIINHANVNYTELLDYLNEQNCIDLSEITQANIESIVVSADLYRQTASNINNLTDHINKVAVSALSNIAETELFANRTITASFYWFVVIDSLIGSKYMQTLPDNVIEFGKHILGIVPKGHIDVALDPIVVKIVNHISGDEKKSKIKEILDTFIHGNTAITPDIFVYFEEMFRTLGDMHSEMPGRCVNNMIKPVFNNSKCLKLILENSEYYINLINIGGAESIELKKLIKTMLSTPNASLAAFASAIGVEIEENKE